MDRQAPALGVVAAYAIREGERTPQPGSLELISIAVPAIVLTAVAACGAYCFARRAPRRSSQVKIVLMGIPLVGSLAALIGSPWIGDDVVDEGLFAYALLFVVLPMAAVAAPLCLGAIIGISVAMQCSTNRPPS